MGNFRHVKVGDRVTRLLSSAMVPMELVVEEVTDDRIRCNTPNKVITDGLLWEFCRDTGVEIDEELGWGPKFGITGSFLKSEESKDDPWL